MHSKNEWYKKIGLEQNPFQLDPLKQEVILDEDTKKELIYRIESDSIIYIEGQEGSGKTSYIKFLLDKYGGKKDVIYLDCKNQNKEINIKNILMERQGFFKKNLQTNMILILDNVQILNKKNSEKLKYYYDNGNLKSIIFTGHSYEEAELTESMRHRIGKKVFSIPKLDEETALKIINMRTNYKEILSETKVKQLLKLSKYNPKSLIKNCEVLCQYLIEENTYDTLQKLTPKQMAQELEKAQEKYIGAESNGRTMV